MCGANEELTRVVEKHAGLPIELNRHMSTLIEKRTHPAGVTNRKCGQLSLGAVLEFEPHAQTAIDQIARGTDPCRWRVVLRDAAGFHG
jgi:hypothetical protein